MNIKELLQQFKDNVTNLVNGITTVKSEQISMKIYENSSGVQYTLGEFFNQYNPEEIEKGQCNLIFRIDLDGHGTIASFQLKDMYNCCGIIVGSDLYVAKKLRNKGFGTLLTKFMQDFSAYYGYGILQGTDKKESDYQKRIFEKLGWKPVNEFDNPKTGNTLIMWIFNLNEYKSKEYAN